MPLHAPRSLAPALLLQPAPATAPQGPAAPGASPALRPERAPASVPIAPDAIYVGRDGPTASLSVLDLYGFGGGTGSPAYDILCPVGPGQTNFPNDPNVSLQGALLVPPLAPGTSTVDGGADGLFTLARDAVLDDRLLRGDVGSVDDLALGSSLDVIINGGLLCASGVNPCAATSLKRFAAVLGGPNTLRPALAGELPLVDVQAGPNPISWSPHPNPPPLGVAPACGGNPWLLANEPTSVHTAVVNLLVPGPFPFGDPAHCLPPVSLLTPEQNVFFQGPSPGSASPACKPYAFRQQVGHLLFVADRAAGDLVVVHSNRMLVLDRIALTDPTRLAMSPNLDFLAVTQQAIDRVTFVDVNPYSSGFLTVAATTVVGDAPSGIAWETGNEDILVCCEGDRTVSVISASTLQVRKTVSNLLTDPFEVVTTPRQDGFGLNRNVYYAWILNRSGELALFESGPDGVNGWGYDDVIGVAPFKLKDPTALQADPLLLEGGVWVTHEDPLDPATGLPTGLGGPAATRVTLSAAVHAQQPILFLMPPNMRDLSFVLAASLDGTVLTGKAQDLAFDDQRNFGSLPNYATPFSAPAPLPMNGKSLVKRIPGSATIENANEPRFLFLAVPSSSEGPGVVDVVDLATLARFDTDPLHPGVQSVPARGARVLMDYFRQ
jgi:hypothetical protein